MITQPGTSRIVQVPDSVFISYDALETIEENAFAEAPLECCGLLLGRFAPPDPATMPPEPLRLVEGGNPFDPTAYRWSGDDDEGMEEAIEKAVEAARAQVRELSLLGGEERAGSFSIPLPDVLTVEEAIPTRNASPHPTKYLVEPEDHFRILHVARGRGLDIVGAYHSHAITKPVPSETDLAEAHPHFLHVIASPDWDTGEGCDVRAWWLVDGNFQEVTIVPVP
jgi:proteasome lid subunit RPN8/RPN11